MISFAEAMQEYKEQLAQGAIQTAYKGLMDYMQALKTHFKTRYPEYAVSGSLYFGYMDMTYFALVPAALKSRGLKIAVVFLHEEFRFEVWLSGANRQVQAQYWERIKAAGFEKYRLVPDPLTADAILEQTLADNPDFSDLDALTEKIERGVMEFIGEVEGLLKGLEGEG
jgi:hypothetical protein